MARVITPVFKFKNMSRKQRIVFLWWQNGSPYRECDGIIADGAIRSGKTLSMSLSFVMWAMETFQGQNLAMCGKTIASFRRNVLGILKLMLRSRGYKYKDRRSDNLLEVTKNGVTNLFYIFGGKDESSQDLIQGITLAGILLDEVALMPESFVNQAVARCSVEGSLYWFNCNPAHPKHWFKEKWIDKTAEKNLLYLHFTMDDNLSLSAKMKARYRGLYVGVFFERFIRGRWVVAEGAIYPQFANNPDDYIIDANEYLVDDRKPVAILVGVDWGHNKSANTSVVVALTRGYKETVVIDEFYTKDEMDPEQLYQKHLEMLAKIERKYGYSQCFCDNAEMMLVRGLSNSVNKLGIKCSVRACVKHEVVDRIVLTNTLFAQGRLKIDKRCTHIQEAFSMAVWDESEKNKQKDIRLDDGTSNIDSLDAFEYALCTNMVNIELAGRFQQ